MENENENMGRVEAVQLLQQKEEKVEEPEKFGWGGRCQPKFCQSLANRKAFLVVFSITCVLQGTFHTYFVAVITTLEKLFAIPSRTTGTLMMASEIGQVSSALLLPYYLGQRHRPRWMAMGSVLFAFATLLIASPHIFIPPNFDMSLNNSTQYCGNLSSEECDTADETPWFLFGIVFASLLCIGLGQTAVYTLGIPYLDDNVASRDSPLYFSITIGVRILGPVTGFILGALCTRLYIYPNNPPNFDPTDPRWLGAWWLGMVVISFLLFLTSAMMFAFPRKLKTNKQITQSKPKMKNFPSALKRLVTNKVLMLRTFSSVFHLLPISGLYTFLPKYLESQFRLAAFEANMVTGISGILVMGVGIFASGVVIRKKMPGAKIVAGWVAMAAFVYSAGMFILIYVGCDAQDFQLLENFQKPNCEIEACSTCSDQVYAPVCADEKIFFSPCHAGCVEGNGTLDSTHTELFDCSCVSTPAKSGLCPLTCSLFPVYLAIFMFIVLFHSTCEVGSMLLTLRCVEPRDKAMALGLIQCAIGLFGNVPCPVIYGAVVDRACTVWGMDCHGNKGHCWFYDSTLFREYFHGMTGALMMVAFVIDIGIYFHANKITLDEEQQLQQLQQLQQQQQLEGLQTENHQEQQNHLLRN